MDKMNDKNNNYNARKKISKYGCINMKKTDRYDCEERIWL